MEALAFVLDLIVHVDVHLRSFVAMHGDLRRQKLLPLLLNGGAP